MICSLLSQAAPRFGALQLQIERGRVVLYGLHGPESSRGTGRILRGTDRRVCNMCSFFRSVTARICYCRYAFARWHFWGQMGAFLRKPCTRGCLRLIWDSHSCHDRECVNRNISYILNISLPLDADSVIPVACNCFLVSTSKHIPVDMQLLENSIYSHYFGPLPLPQKNNMLPP